GRACRSARSSFPWSGPYRVKTPRTWARRPLQVSRARRLGRIREPGADALGVLNVDLHLGDQVLDPGEALLAAQALDEGDAQGAAVEVFFAVDQVGLDQDPPAGLEGRAHADVDRGGDAVGEGRVDAVAGDREAVVGDDVRRREAQFAAALV